MVHQRSERLGSPFSVFKDENTQELCRDVVENLTKVYIYVFQNIVVRLRLIHVQVMSLQMGFKMSQIYK